MNTKRMGRLGLSEAEEDAVVSFLQTMSDGFMPVNRR
jgi:cytochrome c peroxidase